MVHSLRQTKNESFLNRLLEGKDADFQRRVLAITVEHGLSTSDPLFLVMLATGQLQVLLEDKPNELYHVRERNHNKIIVETRGTSRLYVTW